MHVCIDVQSAITLNTGVGRYTRQLVEHLGPLAGTDQLQAVYFDFKGKALPFSVPGITATPVRWCPGRIAQNAWKWLNWPPYQVFSGRADLFHFPNFIRPPLSTGKSVVTIHDVSFLRMPEHTEQKNLTYLTRKIRDTVKHSDALLTDSKFSAGEIADLLAVDPSRITAIHPGISPLFRRPSEATVATTRPRLGLERPYLLTVCTLEPRKNLPFMVEVFERLRTFDGEWVIAGMKGWKFEPILDKIHNSTAASRIRLLDFVADADLPALYAGAELFVFPSLYEGFGFPPLEAMACGTPVVSSTGGSLKEALGSAALCIDSFDHDRWVVDIGRALGDSDLRRRLIADGRQKAASYTWQNTASATWKLYRKLAS